MAAETGRVVKYKLLNHTLLNHKTVCQFNTPPVTFNMTVKGYTL